MTPGGRDGGFALVIVLWTVGLLALLGGHIAAGARSAALLSVGLRGAALAEAAADGVANQAIFHLLESGRARWEPDGAAHPVALPGGRAVVTITDDSGRVDPGTASAALLSALMRRSGVPPAQVAALGAAMLDWRSAGLAPSPGGAKNPQYLAAGRAYGPPRERYGSVEEVLLVLGMTQEVYERIAPFLSVHKSGGVDLRRADPVVAAALTDTAGPGSPMLQPAAEGAPHVVQIMAQVTMQEGAHAVRRAQVEIGNTDDDAARPYRVLTWD